jgi:thiol-disulfide isomerase/thioredoxin
VADTSPDTELSADTLARLRSDPEARLEFLIGRDVLVERDDGRITATQEFELDRGVYVDSYADSSDAEFRQTVAELFDLSPAQAAARIEELSLSRWEIATYLTLREFISVALPADALLELAAMTADAGSASPVPLEMDELFDEDWDQFVADHGDVVLFVFQQACDPCEAMKRELDEIRAQAPGDVVFAGLNGDEVPEFRREFDVTVAPTTLVFADGNLAAEREGYASPETLAETFDDAY